MGAGTTVDPAGDVTALGVLIVDGDGVTVPTLNTTATATASGGARVLAFSANGEVPITRGQGRGGMVRDPDKIVRMQVAADVK